jgi:hypothetical protein
MIMEYVSGGELFEYIVKHGKVRYIVGRWAGMFWSDSAACLRPVEHGKVYSGAVGRDVLVR